jgi:hypothetical protein
MTRATGTFALVFLVAHATASGAQSSNQNTYPSAEAAAEALFRAVQARDEKGLSQVLGEDEDLFSAEDEGQQGIDRQRFVEKYQQMHRLAREPDGTVLYLGAENWPFPVPLISKNGGWSFDTQSGTREILFRRIGANESFAIDVCHALAHSDERHLANHVGNAAPVHGYYFRALPARGRPAFYIAYPADYRSSGVMTFVVGRDDVIYERDMGPQTAKFARTTTGFKPDSTWHVLQ